MLDAKKAEPITTSKPDEAALSPTKIGSFIGDLKTEIKRIHWTSSEELRVYTKIVVGMTLVLGLGIYMIDLSIQSFLMILTSIIHWLS